MTSTVGEAVEAVRAGGLVVLPTDTVYGIGCDPGNDDAVARLFEAKRRPRSLVLPVLVDGLETAERLARFDDRSRAIAETFWPGSVTIVLRRTPESAAWSLGEERATVGIRAPAAEIALELLRATGPLAVTSANLSGDPTPETCAGVRGVFGGAVSVYLCGDEQIAGTASTVVDVSGDEPRILREGSLTERVRALL